MLELLWAWCVVCRNFSGLRAGYAGTVVRPGGYAGTFGGSRGVGAGTFVSSRGGMTEYLGAHGRVCQNF